MIVVGEIAEFGKTLLIRLSAALFKNTHLALRLFRFAARLWRD